MSGYFFGAIAYLSLTLTLLSPLNLWGAYSPQKLKDSLTQEGTQLKIKLMKSARELFLMGTDLKQQIPDKKSVQYEGRKKLLWNCNHLPQKNALLVAQIGSKAGVVAWDNKRYVGEFEIYKAPLKEGCDLIQKVNLEDYIVSILNKEMNADWPIEALKAQAVAARSYALFKKIESEKLNKHYHLENSEKDQVSGSLDDFKSSARMAQMQTGLEVLVGQKNAVVPTFFHAKCGGHTFLPEDVWGNKVSGYQKRVKCPYCAHLGNKEWSKKINYQTFLGIYPQLQPATAGLFFKPDRYHLPTLNLEQNNQQLPLPKSQIRKKLGTKLIPSNHFRLYGMGQSVMLYGSGLGHGVGMCQLGALQMAKEGKNYRQILSHYYPDLKLMHLSKVIP